MPPDRFHWHSDARAFAGTQAYTPAADSQSSPTAKPFAVLHGALDTDTPFCITDTAGPGLPSLSPAQFATLTGGTSGTPKIIARTHASWTRSFAVNAAQFNYTSADSIAVLGALTHSLALYGVLEGLHLGLNVHALGGLSPMRQSAEVRAHRCTILYATPTQLQLLPSGHPLPEVRLILCGGGALTAAVRSHIIGLCPNAALHVFYGAAETSFITMSDAHTPENSVGRAFRQVEIEVRKPDVAGVGTIWVRSPYLFDRYVSGNSIHTQWDRDWLSVGELGRIDAQGYLFLSGRAGRVINIADQTIYPEELERAFGTLDGMAHCAVLSRHDALRGRHLIVAVQGTEDQEVRRRLLTFCKDNGLISPKSVVFLDAFPRLTSGKPDLRRLAAMIGASP